MRYLKLLVLFLKSSLQTELEYRANFLVQALMRLFWASFNVFSAIILFARTDEIGGWRFDQVLIIIGLFEFINGIVEAFLQPNVRRIISMVRDGTMDFVLTKPVNSQFMASVRYSQVSGITHMLAGPAILLIGFARMNYTPSPWALAQFALMLLMAVILVYSIWMMMATVAFWVVKVDELGELFNALWETGRFPITTFQGGVRIALTFVLPVAFMTTFPAQAVLNTLDPRWLIAAVVMGLAALFLCTRFWRFAVRSYSSASS